MNYSTLLPLSSAALINFSQALASPMVDVSNVGELSSGETVQGYVLKAGNSQLSLIEYGASMTHWITPDKNGKATDIILGYDTLQRYEDQPRYFGTITGRHAGRIENGAITIDGKLFQLTINNGANHLHGGTTGLDKVLWKSRSETTKDYAAVHFSHFSPNGHEGFPGNLIINVSYFLYTNNELHIRYRAISDETTVLNLTQHAYFNLSGDHSQTIDDHELQINSDEILELRADSIPTGTRLAVTGTPFDFSRYTALGEQLHKTHDQLTLGKGLDHYWTRNNNTDTLETIAKLKHEGSGLQLTVKTTEPGIQVYTANHLNDKDIGKGGIPYQPYGGICLETGQYPNAVNEKGFPLTLLKAGDIWESTTVYSLNVELND